MFLTSAAELLGCSSFRPVGGCHAGSRLQTSIPTPASHFTPGQVDCDQRPGKSSGTGPGTVRPPGQGCDRGGGPPAATQGILLDVFSCAEKDRRVSSHSRSQGTKPVSESSAFSHAHHCAGAPDCGEGRVVYIDRSFRCLLPCAYCGRTSPLSQICLSGSPLAIPSAPVRPLSFPEGVYSVCDSGPFSSSGQRPEDSTLSRRLAALRPFLHSRDSGYRSPPCSCDSVGPPGQLGEELPGPVSDDDLSRRSSGHNFDEGAAIQSQGGRRPGVDWPLQAGQAVTLRHLPAASRQADVAHVHCALGLAVSAPSAAVGQQFSPRCHAAQASRSDGYTGLSSGPDSMEGPGLFVQRCSHGPGGVPQRGGHYRCQPHRMGRCVAAQCSTGAVVPEGSFQTHKCTGAAGYPVGSQTFSTSSGGKTCPSSVRQHLGCVPHQSSRGHQIDTASEGVDGSFEMGRSSSLHSAGSILAGRAQRGCRFSVTPDTCSGGVASSHRRGAYDLGPFRSSGGGSVCFGGVNPLPQVVFPYGGSGCTGPGRAGSSMASCPPLRFPADSSAAIHSTESSQGGPPIVTGGPILASSNMVSAATQSVSRSSMASSGQERSVVSVERTDLASRSSPSQVVRVAAGGSGLQLTDCSDPVRHTILSSRASSTRQQYANRWRLFSRWCSTAGVDPVSCPVPTVLEFLQSLLEEGRSPSTLKVYVAAISCHHVKIDGCTVGSHDLVSLFLRGARRLRPLVAPRAPVWDLPLVLDALCCRPFEPLVRADLKWLSCKTAFLLAIASAKRVSELHALSVSPSCLRWSPDGSGVTLWPNTAFVPKVLPRSHCNQPLTLSRFQPPSEEGLNGSELLCPVRALEAYIAATAGRRRSDQLFLCYGGPKMGYPVSKQRLSHWIVDVISCAYSKSGQSPPMGLTAHSTRGVATSWAAMRGVPLNDICAAASWASPTTFTRFYNINVAAPHPLSQVLLQGSSGSSR